MDGRLIGAVALCVLAAGCNAVSESTTSVVAGGAQPAGDARRGAALFAQNCAVCHGTGGAGSTLGPALLGERNRLDYRALVSWIEDPQPPMPKLYPAPLSSQQLFDVAAYVQRL